MEEIFTIPLAILDIDECKNPELNECDADALCTNVEGFYICRCLRGYQGDGLYCAGKRLPRYLTV